MTDQRVKKTYEEKEMPTMTDEERKQENDRLIGCLAEALEIVRAKCRRCGAQTCLGCCFDSVARGFIPDNIERSIDLMGSLPTSRRDVIEAARISVAERDAMGKKISDE